MKLSVIKELVENYSLEQLKKSEAAMEEGETPTFEIKGEDEGEQFTHIIAAVWIKEKMATDGIDARSAMREYTQKVRNSIS
ncbi:hypothetical protein Fleli_1030 [Bernardetia litoralis DSM 6794]|uniref:Uncharacterized protein n=1 Tax=Bernardetia litoralis (strain ATCC 23117 / DSM 6794 / NBRC 15988 / NCIMB 1366 / Fx l1 / Sio-4) TaxID=880071 RepID=I4AHP0_BERLS|nr:hypothetical protein [Bernardetia litoralis]AFM03475.1 hypothetical protein Fleli_1030 [Bernardetia litoralis DSM 6794]